MRYLLEKKEAARLHWPFIWLLKPPAELSSLTPKKNFATGPLLSLMSRNSIERSSKNTASLSGVPCPTTICKSLSTPLPIGRLKNTILRWQKVGIKSATSLRCLSMKRIICNRTLGLTQNYCVSLVNADRKSLTFFKHFNLLKTSILIPAAVFPTGIYLQSHCRLTSNGWKNLPCRKLLNRSVRCRNMNTYISLMKKERSIAKL